MEDQIIDSHQHFWQVSRFDYPWMSSEVEVLYRDYLPEALEPVLRENGVARTVAVQASNSVEETRWLLGLADAHPFVAGVVGWVDLASPEVGRQLDELAAHPKFKGVRHLVEDEPEDDWLVRPDVLRGMRELASRGVSYDLLVRARHLTYARQLADECPDLRLVVDHAAKPPVATGEIKDWARGLKALAACPNVSCKLSGLVTEADHVGWRTEDLRPYVGTALELFGPGRLIYGSDWPVCLLAAGYERVLESFQTLLAGLGEDDRRRVFRGNASDFYRL